MKARVETLILTLLLVNGVLSTLEYNLGIYTPVKTLVLAIALALSFWAIYFKDRDIQIKTVVGLAFLGNEVFLFALPILFIPMWLAKLIAIQGKISVRKAPLVVLGFLAYCLVLAIVTNLIEFSLLNFLLWILIAASWMIMFVFYARSFYTEEEATQLFGFLRKLILFQIPVMLLQSIIHRDFYPGDSWTGTSGNSVVVGFYFCLYLIAYFSPYFFRIVGGKSVLRVLTIRNLLLVGGFGILFYLNDSKMTIFVFIISLIFYFLFILVLRFVTTFKVLALLRVLIVSAALAVAMIALVIIADWYGKVKYNTDDGIAYVLKDYIDPQLKPEGTNAKFVLYRRVYADLFHDNFLAWTFGLGPGRFGGKASNIMAYDVLYKEEGQLRLPSQIKPFSTFYTKKYMGDLWTEEIASTSQFRSATLSFPFAGLATVKGEYGFVGLMLFLFVTMSLSYFLIQRATALESVNMRSWAVALSLFWFSLPFHMIFDNFQEKLYILFPMAVLSAVIYSISSTKAVENRSI